MAEWVVKNLEDEYLHNYEVGPHLDLRNMRWIKDQAFARRFSLRNYAAEVALKLKARVVKLTPTDEKGGSR